MESNTGSSSGIERNACPISSTRDDETDLSMGSSTTNKIDAIVFSVYCVLNQIKSRICGSVSQKL
jgi:hypothetical protein